MSHMAAFIFSLLTILGAVWVALFGLRPVPHRIPAEPFAVGLATVGDLHAGAVGGFTEFADGTPAEQLVGLLVVIFSIFTLLIVAYGILKKELPFGLKKQYHEAIVLTGPVAAALAGLMSFSTTCKLLERYTYADALASGYAKNFVAPVVRSLKAKGLEPGRFIIYIPAEPGHLWHHLVDIKNNSEDKGWRCNWHLENYSGKEETTRVGVQDGKPISRTVLGVETANGKYWVDFPRTLATLGDSD